MSADTILHRLHNHASTRPNTPAYYEKVGQAWVPTSWSEYNNQVRGAAKSLMALGFEPGNIVNILGFNKPEWVILDLAGMLAGGASAGIYTTNSPAECKYIIEHSEAPIVLLEDEGQWEKIKQVREDIPTLKHVIMMKGVDVDDPMVMSWEEFMAKGNDIPDAKADEALNALKPEQLATMIYTSGTTGPPKGVMLSHENLSFTSGSSIDLLHLNSEDSVLSYLPLSHIAEQMFTIHTAISTGYQVYYAESLDKLADNLREVNPTVVFGVPRVWERFYAGVTARLSEATGARAKIAEWAQGVGRRAWALKHQGQEPSGMLAFQYRLADRLVYSKLKPALGMAKMRHCISGAAPIQPEILEFFSGLDIPIYEVYGQSEDCGPTSTNRPGATKYGTVGQAWPGVEVKIADDDEILVRGKNVFMGYYKNQEATDKDLQNGWLHSGDLGKKDADGYLSIIGRKKEIMITAGGKNIAPKNIEAALKNGDLVAEAVLIADRRKFVSALLTLEPEALAKFAEENGISGDNLHEHPQIVAEVQKGVDEKCNAYFARVEQVRKFTILPRQFTVEDGELTPTQKIKRRIIDKNWEEEIEGMYN
ncbi:MAG: long-chain fatty acid--CoA ligase [Chloroflexota bacterium]